MHETDILPSVARKCPFSGVYKHLCVCVCTCVWAVCVCVYICTACGGPMLMLGDFLGCCSPYSLRQNLSVEPIVSQFWLATLLQWSFISPFQKAENYRWGPPHTFPWFRGQNSSSHTCANSALLAELFIQPKFCFLLDPESYSGPGWPGTRSVGQGWLQIHGDPSTSDSQDAVYGLEPSCLATFKFFIVVKT